MKRVLIIIGIFSLAVIHSKAQNGGFTADVTFACLPSGGMTTVTFTPTGDAATATSWDWDFGDGSTHSYNNPATRAYNTAGTYTVTLTYIKNGQQYTHTETNFITISAGPSVHFSSTKVDDICPGEAISFSSTTVPSGNAIASYLWDFGDGGNSRDANPTHRFGASGDFSIVLTVTDTFGCSRTLTQTNLINVMPGPVADFVADNPNICVKSASEPKTVTFTNTSTGAGTSFRWSFGDGGTANTDDQTVTHTYNNGIYDVTLIASSDNGCTDTMKKEQYIAFVIFNADFSGDGVICGIPGTATFTAINAQNPEWWFEGSSQGIIGSTVSVTYNTPGTYDIIMVGTNGGCRDTIAKRDFINVFDITDPVISIKDTFRDFDQQEQQTLLHCDPNAAIVFKNETIDTGINLGLGSTTWSFGDGSPNQSGNTVSHVFPGYGFYDITCWVVTNSGCTLTTYTTTIAIIPFVATSYIVDPDMMQGPVGGCAPHTVTVIIDPQTLQTSSPVTEHIWDWGVARYNGEPGNHADYEDSTNTGGTPMGMFTYQDTGIYDLEIILVNQQGCTTRPQNVLPVIPVGYMPLCNWTFDDTMKCLVELSIPVVAYDSIYVNGSDTTLHANAWANEWIWYDKDDNELTRGQQTQLSPVDTGWIIGHKLECVHNDCKQDPQITIDSIGYACPPMTGIDNPKPDMQGNDPYFCDWPTFGFDALGDGPKTKAWDSIIWKLGNDYIDSYGTYHPENTVHIGRPAGSGDGNPNPPLSYKYDTLGGMDMLRYKNGVFYVKIWGMNDNREGNNLCGYCEDSSEQVFYISVAEMKLRATEHNSAALVNNFCEGQTIDFHDSTVSSQTLIRWGLTIVDSIRNIRYSTAQLSRKMGASFGQPGRGGFPYKFDEYGVYYVYLIDTDAFGCGKGDLYVGHPAGLSWEGRTDVLRIEVNPRSIPAFSSMPACTGDSIALADLSYTISPFDHFKITNYLWNIGGMTSTLQNPKFVFPNPGSYPLQLTVTNEKGCDSTLADPTNIINVNGTTTSFRRSPNDIRICNRSPIILINQSTAIVDGGAVTNANNFNFYWEFDEGRMGTSTLANPTFRPNVDTSRWVRITLTATEKSSGCKNTMYDSVYVMRPIAEFTVDKESDCVPFTVDFINQSTAPTYGTGLLYEWNFGDPNSESRNTSKQEHPSHIYENRGEYDVTLIVTTDDQFRCQDTMKKPEYIVTYGPNGEFFYSDSSFCVPESVKFTFNVTTEDADTLLFYPGDGSVFTSEYVGMPVHWTYTDPGYYIPSVMLTKWIQDPNTGELRGCKQGIVGKDTIWAIKLTPDFETEPLYCLDIPVTFKNLTDTANGNIAPNNATIDYMLWNFGNEDSSDVDFHGTTYYYTSGIHTVTLFARIKACEATKKKEIRVMEFPPITFFPDSVDACISLDVTLYADSLNGEETQFDWDFEEGFRLSGNPVHYYFEEPGINAYPFKVLVTFTPKDCQKYYFDTLIVAAWPLPIPEFSVAAKDGTDLTDAINGVPAGEDAFFTDESTIDDNKDGGQITNWFWDFGDGNTDSAQNPVHAYLTRSGYVTVKLGVTDEHGCSDTIYHQVLIIESLEFPNIFSPNGDGINDIFEPRKQDKSGYFLTLEMEIYNKWGALVWKRKCESPNCPDYQNESFWWDGRNQQGNNVPEGVYYWVIYARPESERGDFILNGSVTVVR